MYTCTTQLLIKMYKCMIYVYISMDIYAHRTHCTLNCMQLFYTRCLIKKAASPNHLHRVKCYVISNPRDYNTIFFFYKKGNLTQNKTKDIASSGRSRSIGEVCRAPAHHCETQHCHLLGILENGIPPLQSATYAGRFRGNAPGNEMLLHSDEMRVTVNLGALHARRNARSSYARP